MHDLFVSGVLKSSFAKHKFLLLLGPRWRPADSALVQRLNDALVSGAEALESLYASEPLGEFKITSSDLPHQSQNMKWCSDVLDKMIAESNKEPTFADVPLDVRPYISSTSRGGQIERASIADFPKEWL